MWHVSALTETADVQTVEEITHCSVSLLQKCA